MYEPLCKKMIPSYERSQVKTIRALSGKYLLLVRWFQFGRPTGVSVFGPFQSHLASEAYFNKQSNPTEKVQPFRDTCFHLSLFCTPLQSEKELVK